MATPRVAAGALFLDPAGRILLVHTTYKQYWDIPGGYAEPGESPLQACRREVSEELDIEPPIGDLLVVDWAPIDDEGDKLLFVFDGGTLDSDPPTSAASDEIDGWSYVALDEIDKHLPHRLTLRLHLAIAAREQRRATYAEHGHHPTPTH